MFLNIAYVLPILRGGYELPTRNSEEPDYFWMLEPHKTGYAHMHLLYWRILSESEQEHIRKLWERKYQAGKDGIGIGFSLPEASEDGTFKAGSIAKVRSYPIKYLSKGLYKKWNPAELLFNAVLWKTKTRMWGCSRNFSKIMKPEIQEREDWECSEVWLCDTDENEEPDLVWSKERKESGLLGSGKNSNSLVDCEKETTHHSVYSQPRCVTMKEHDEKLLREVCKPESAFYNYIRLRVSKPVWTFIQTVPSLKDSMLKKISSGMLRAEERTMETINYKSGVPSFVPEYWLYEPILQDSE